MNEDIEMFLDESGCYLESLIKSRKHLLPTHLLNKLDLLIEAELDLAIMGAKKAKSEILKTNPKDNLRPIK